MATPLAQTLMTRIKECFVLSRLMEATTKAMAYDNLVIADKQLGLAHNLPYQVTRRIREIKMKARKNVEHLCSWARKEVFIGSIIISTLPAPAILSPL